MTEELSPLNSAVCLFDDLSTCYKSLMYNTCEQEFLKYLSKQKINSIKYQESINECKRLRETLNSTVKDVSTLHSKLCAAKKILQTERERRKKMEKERNACMNQLHNVRQSFCSDSEQQISDFVVKRNITLNECVPNSWEISKSSTLENTKSEEDLDDITIQYQNYKKHGCCENDEPTVKRHKLEEVDGQNRNLKNLCDRQHVFVGRNVIIPKKCLSCQKKLHIGNMSYKCSKCNAVSHSWCRNKVPIPCAEVGVTPKKGFKRTISDIAPSTSPKIPAIVIHCINRIEQMGLKELGLYRISGNERVLRTLKEKIIKGRGIPSLDDVDVHTVCTYLKDFLRNLDDPLIPQKERVNFIEITTKNNISKLEQLVVSLPDANKHTLAFLILHFQRVASNVESRMSIQNLANVLAPTIIGYSCMEPLDPIYESETSILIMLKLLELSSEFWNGLISEPVADKDQGGGMKEKNLLKTSSYDLRKPQKLLNTPRTKRRFFALPISE